MGRKKNFVVFQNVHFEILSELPSGDVKVTSLVFKVDI